MLNNKKFIKIISFFFTIILCFSVLFPSIAATDYNDKSNDQIVDSNLYEDYMYYDDNTTRSIASIIQMRGFKTSEYGMALRFTNFGVSRPTVSFTAIFTDANGKRLAIQNRKTNSIFPFYQSWTQKFYYHNWHKVVITWTVVNGTYKNTQTKTLFRHNLAYSK